MIGKSVLRDGSTLNGVSGMEADFGFFTVTGNCSADQNYAVCENLSPKEDVQRKITLWSTSVSTLIRALTCIPLDCKYSPLLPAFTFCHFNQLPQQVSKVTPRQRLEICLKMEKFKSRSGDQEVSALIPLLPLQGKWSYGKSLQWQHQYHHGSWKARVVHPPEKTIPVALSAIEKYLLRTVFRALFFYLIFSPVYFFHYVMVCPLLAMRISHMWRAKYQSINFTSQITAFFCFVFCGFFFHPLRESNHSSSRMK